MFSWTVAKAQDAENEIAHWEYGAESNSILDAQDTRIATQKRGKKFGYQVSKSTVSNSMYTSGAICSYKPGGVVILGSHE